MRMLLYIIMSLCQSELLLNGNNYFILCGVPNETKGHNRVHAGSLCSFYTIITIVAKLMYYV